MWRRPRTSGSAVRRWSSMARPMCGGAASPTTESRSSARAARRRHQRHRRLRLQRQRSPGHDRRHGHQQQPLDCGRQTRLGSRLWRRHREQPAPRAEPGDRAWQHGRCAITVGDRARWRIWNGVLLSGPPVRLTLNHTTAVQLAPGQCRRIGEGRRQVHQSSGRPAPRSDRRQPPRHLLRFVDAIARMR